MAAIAAKRLGDAIRSAIKPATGGLVLGLVADLTRSHAELLTENALLRQQLIVLRRLAKRPKIRRNERAIMVVLAALTRGWRDAVLLVRPETILRWHRAGFRLFWRKRSRTTRASARLSSATIAVIKRMALDNRLWGAERVRGELLKLGIRVSKRTVQKYMRLARGPQPWGQSWSTFLKNHASQVWACDFLQTYDIFFRPIFAFFIVELESRRVVHVGVTRSPTSAWTAQQLREATPFDRKSSLRPVRAPKANAVCERYLGTARRECLDHVLILSERHMLRVLKEHVAHFNRGRPHQGIDQRVPTGLFVSAAPSQSGQVVAHPVLGGLHHDYRWAA